MQEHEAAVSSSERVLHIALIVAMALLALLVSIPAMH